MLKTNKENKKKTKIEKLQDLIIEEKTKDQEEIIEFYYEDKESKTKLLIKDKRKIHVAIMEMDLYEMKQHDDIVRNECPYNPKTDDPIDEQNDIEEFEYEETEFEKQLEDALQELSNKMWQMKENSEKISNFFRKNIHEFDKNQVIIIFLYYYLDLKQIEIAKILGLVKSTISYQIDQIQQKMCELGAKID